MLVVYKIPYPRARAWPLGRVRARAKVSCIQRQYMLLHFFNLYAKYLCSQPSLCQAWPSARAATIGPDILYTTL